MYVYLSPTLCEVVSLYFNSLAGTSLVLAACAGLVLAAHDLYYIVFYWRRHWHVVINYHSHLAVSLLFLEEMMQLINSIYTVVITQ